MTLLGSISSSGTLLWNTHLETRSGNTENKNEPGFLALFSVDRLTRFPPKVVTRVTMQVKNHYIQESRDRLVVRTLRCGRNNPGSNPGYGNVEITFFLIFTSCKFYVPPLLNVRGSLFIEVGII